MVYNIERAYTNEDHEQKKMGVEQVNQVLKTIMRLYNLLPGLINTLDDNIHFEVIEASHPELPSLIAHSIGHPTEEKINRDLKAYNAKNNFLLGCFEEKILVGVIGLEEQADYKFILSHISILPDHRLHGLGKALIDEVLERFKINKLIAETDDDSVGFYRATGFHCEATAGEFGLRYLCTLTSDNILLEDYNPEWPRMASDEIEHLKKLLPSKHILGIEHVGSTAIPGMVAKPIIDIQIAVDSLAEAKKFAINSLEANGYAYWYNNPDPERMFFVKGMPPFGKKRTHHVHMYEPSCPQWPNKIIFRDYLIAHPEVANEYAILKRALAEAHAQDRESYTDAKTSFVERVLDLAK
jgi:GrpB-like predicted nucleotidyltransferase (UPF0157 family)